MRMIQKKKILIFTLLCACTFCLTACSQQKIEEIAGKLTELNTETDAETETEIETETETVAEEETDSENVNPLSFGRIEGGIYTNEYAGFACELDSAWEFYSVEELQEMPENIVEMLEGTEIGEAAEQFEQIMDMQAENVNELTSMNVLYQKIGLVQSLQYKSMGESELMESLVTQQDSMVESYAMMGIEVESVTTKQVTFLGEERTALYTVAKYEGIDYYIFQLMDFDLGQYSVTLTVSSFVEDKTEELLGLFYGV